MLSSHRVHGAAGGAWLAVVIALGLTLLSCQSKSIELPAVPAVEGRFPHSLHSQRTCIDCHEPKDVIAGRPATPGKRDHAPCDESGCHREQFLAATSKLCEICHTSVDPVGSGTVAASYPPTSGPRSLASDFDHAKHLDFGRMERAVGFHVSCSDCHASEGGQLKQPGHKACGRCHAPEAAPPGVPALGECQRCHRERRVQPARVRELIIGDLVFSHASHRVDRKGGLIQCVECHAGSPTHAGTGNHPRPPTSACVKCHDDSSRVAPNRRMRICETCHSTRRAGIGQIAPRSHLPASERPLDHTLAFRRDHGADAQRDATRCARCHTVLSGSSRDVCDECHGVMRPHDHTVTWREYDHGQEAATEAERCSTCHAADFCTTCHLVTPRSHFPLMTFRDGAHAGPAMLNPRACVTCHPQVSFCSRPGCHTVGP